ncbi:MAG: diguanylate cyclase [Actinomycetota bacterium]
MTLRTRLTLFFVGIVVLPLLAATVAFQVLSARQADSRTDTRLQTGSKALAAFWQERLQGVSHEVTLISRDLAPDLSDSKLPEKVKDARLSSGLDFLIVAESGGRIRAADLDPAQYPPGVEAPSARELAAAREPGSVLRAKLEIVEGDDRSFVIGGRYADASLAVELQQMTGLDVAVVSSGRTLASTGEPPAEIPGPGSAIEMDGQRSVLVPVGSPNQGIVLTAEVEGGASPLTWLVAALGLLAATVLGFALAGVIARPLQRLVQGARAVAAGELDHRVEAGDHGDVARVADAFNTMTDYLRTYVGELQSSRDELRGSLERMGATLRTTLDLGGMLEVVLDTAAVTLGARAGALFLLRGGSRQLRLEVARGYKPPEDAGLAVGEGIAGHAAATGAPILISDGGGPTTSEPVEPSATTAVSVPLVRGDRTIGVIALYGRTTLEPFERDDAETLSSFAGQASVAIENVLLHQETRQLSITDGLTGVWNRRYLEMTLRKEIERAQRFGRPLSLLMLDIDRFKRVNDRHGHQRGDEVLIEVTRRILGEIRTNIDVVGRYGGEEFVVLLPETPSGGGFVVAEKIRTAMRDQQFVGSSGDPLTVTVSVGMSTYPEDGTTAEELVRRADTAMYRAKSEGRDRVVATSP